MAKAKTTPKPRTSKNKKTTKSTELLTPIVHYCSFCRKSSETQQRLIAGSYAFICDECVEICVAILLDDNKKEWTERLEKILSGKKKFKIQDVNKKPPKRRKKC
jgi:hypothetical protein